MGTKSDIIVSKTNPLRRSHSRVRIFDPKNPAHLYLNSITENSAKTMERCLDAIAKLLKEKVFNQEEMPEGFSQEEVYMDDVNWTVLKRHHVQGVLRVLESQDKSPATISTYLAAIKGVMKEAYLSEPPLISLERYERIKSLSTKRGLRNPKGQAISLNTVKKAIEGCNDNTLAGVRDKAILCVLLGAGLRRTECAQLKMSDIDSINKRLNIIGKGNKERSVPVEDAVIYVINEWLGYRGSKEGPLFCQIRRGKRPKEGEFYYGNIDYAGLTDSGVYQICQKRGIPIDINGEPCNILKPHNLRRTYGTELDKALVALPTISELLGHSDLKTTQKYIYDDKEAKKEDAVNDTGLLSRILTGSHQKGGD